ncbi:MAG: serine/threonine protein kinase [Gemmataceae bacterium]|nr:serine/threonine protein kinase [Gemmataceae bacterium]
MTDFGLARRLADDSRLTPPGYALGTPACLAPELLQPAADRPVQPTVAGDVYALGAILYECLTGRPPFRADSPIGTLLAVLRTSPPRPRAVAPGVPTDLETVCLKCLDRDPARRYPRAADLADELDRWRRGEPVVARPIGSLARFGRWCRRQLIIAGLAGGLAVSVGVGLAVSYREWRRAEENYQTAEGNYQTAEQHRRTAETRETEAEANFWLAHDAVCRFYDEFDERHLKDVPGLKAARRAALKDARGYFERFVAQGGQDPKLRRELAAAHFRIAEIDHTTGAIADALAGYGRALAVYEVLAVETPDDPKVRRNLPRTLQRIATVQASFRPSAETLPVGLRARALFEELARQEPDDPDHLVDLAAVLNTLGNEYRRVGRVREAGQCFEAKIEVCGTLLRRWPDHPDGPAPLARGFQNLAYIASALGAPEMYVCWSLAGIGVLDDHLRHRPGHNPTRKALARSLRDLASYHCSRKQPAEALAVLARARALLTALATADPEDVDVQTELSAHHRQIGHAQLIAGDAAAAGAAYDRARQVAEQLTARHGDVPEYQDEVANCYFDLGVAHARRNDWDASVRAFRQAADIRTRLCATDPGRAAIQHKLGRTLRNLAGLYAQRQRRDEAAEIYGRAAAADEAAVRAAPESADNRRGLADCYAGWATVERERGRFAAAAAVTGRRRDLFPAEAAELTAAAREFARIADRDTTPLPPAEAEACRRAADAAVAALRAAAARDAAGYARVRQEPVFARLRDRLPVLPPSPGK